MKTYINKSSGQEEFLIDARSAAYPADSLREEVEAFGNAADYHAALRGENAVPEGVKVLAVSSVEHIVLDDPVPVYDVTDMVTPYRCFALANGSVVHNSGGMRFARFEQFQEFLPLQGKPKNLVGTKKATEETSVEVLNILAMIGVDPKSADPLGNLRISKLIVMADADPDGPLVGSTKVKMVDGSVKTMKQLAKEWEKNPEPQWVWSVDSGGRLHPSKAYLPTEVKRVKKLIKVYFDDGLTIECDENHAWPSLNASPEEVFKTEHGIEFVRAGNLRPGHSIPAIRFEADGNSSSSCRVTRTEVLALEDHEPVYCMAVPGFANFLLEDSKGNGVATGNSHIQTLIFGILYKYVPEMFDRGMIYVTRVPEYYSIVGDKVYSGDSLEDVQDLLKADRAKGTVNHVKGYGEIDSKLLRLFACDPETRCLYQVKAKSFDRFELLMGGDSSPRKQLLGL
jgi:DNA gyrase subunit B